VTDPTTENGLLCLDRRKPVPMHEPHGVHHVQTRLPLLGRNHLCITVTSGRYFVSGVDRGPRMKAVRLPFLSVALVKRKQKRPSASYMRWCGHIKVEHPTSPGRNGP
jgi:hypothetical protein